MKIIKLIKNHNHYYAMFDEIPEMTYEKIGSDYIGSVVDSNGLVIFSDHLGYDRATGNMKAFAGREIQLSMKDGNIQTIKDHWWDCGSYKKHGKFINIGAGTLEKLQRCFVFFSMNINEKAFFNMVEDYYTRDKLYEYDEVREWARLQYQWYPVIINEQQISYMMNEYGDMVEKESKKAVYPRRNVCKKINGKWKTYTYFKFEYKDEDNKLIKIEANYLKVLKSTLPLSEEEIKINCKL